MLTGQADESSAEQQTRLPLASPLLGRGEHWGAVRTLPCAVWKASPRLGDAMALRHHKNRLLLECCLHAYGVFAQFSRPVAVIAIAWLTRCNCYLGRAHHPTTRAPNHLPEVFDQQGRNVIADVSPHLQSWPELRAGAESVQ